MIVDVIMLSTPATRSQTLNSILTLKNSENEISFNVIIIEDSEYDYPGVTNLRIREEFNYNRFMNIGAEQCDSEYIVFANNDLSFFKGWFTEMLKHGLDCMSPKCPIDIRQIHHVDEVVSGYETGSILSGWCFVMKRALWELIGGLDEDFKFWCADNATVEQLKIVGVKPNLITKSLVQHLGSQTLKGLDKEVRHELTMVQVDLFNKKYNKNLFNRRKYDKMD